MNKGTLHHPERVSSQTEDMQDLKNPKELIYIDTKRLNFGPAHLAFFRLPAPQVEQYSTHRQYERK
jgi:hypothetical protein